MQRLFVYIFTSCLQYLHTKLNLQPADFLEALTAEFVYMISPIWPTSLTNF